MGSESKRTRNEAWPFALKQEGHTFVQGAHYSFTVSATGYASGSAKATEQCSRRAVAFLNTAWIVSDEMYLSIERHRVGSDGS